MTRSRIPPGGRLADRLAGRLDGRAPPDTPSTEASGTAPQVLGTLSKAATPEAVLAAVAGSGGADLPEPIRDVVERIRREADRWERARSGRPRQAAAARRTAGGRALPEPSPRPGTDERMERLVRRLVHLVHLAEVDRRQYAARRSVRMALATAEAVQEAAPTAPPGAAGGQAPDLEALGRQVLEAVTRILESRQQRRQEEPDVRYVWW